MLALIYAKHVGRHAGAPYACWAQSQIRCCVGLGQYGLAAHCAGVGCGLKRAMPHVHLILFAQTLVVAGFQGNKLHHLPKAILLVFKVDSSIDAAI